MKKARRYIAVAMVVIMMLTNYGGVLASAAQKVNVYVYVQVNGNIPGLRESSQATWYTIGKIEAAIGSARGSEDASEWQLEEALANLNKIEWYRRLSDSNKNIFKQYLNSINRWHLHSASGATDYVNNTTAQWHMDGFIDVGYTVVKHYGEQEEREEVLGQTYGAVGRYEAAKSAVYGGEEYRLDEERTGELSCRIESLDPTKNEIHVYYKKKVTIQVTGSSESVLYDGKMHSVSGYTVSGVPAGVEVRLAGEEKAEISKVDAGSYPMGLSKESFTVEGEEKDRYYIELEVEDGSLTIGKRNVTLKSGSGEREYNGEALRNEKVEVGGDGFAEKEGVRVEVKGSQLEVGSSANEFEYELEEGTKAENYTITKEYGELKVTDRKEKYEIRLEAKSETVKYNGEEQRVEGFKTLSFEIEGKTYTVSGVSAGASGVSAGEYPVSMNIAEAVVRDEAGNEVTRQFEIKAEAGAKLTITKRKVILTSASAEKEYDGEALENKEVIESGDGFVKEEGAVYEVTGSRTIVGESANSFSYELKEGTNAENYEIEKVEGKLEIKERTEKYHIELEAVSQEKQYNGEEQEAEEEFKSLRFIAENGKSYRVEGARVEGAGRDAGSYPIRIDTTEVVVLDEKNEEVTEQFIVSGKEGAELTIKPIEITITARSDRKVYDGKALTNGGYSQSGAFVKDEGFARVSVTGSQRGVGESANTISYELNEKTKAGNYIIVAQAGKLTVTGRSEEEKAEIHIEPESAEKTYNGSEQGVEGFISLHFEIDGEVYEVEGIQAGAEGREAGVYPVEISGRAVVKDIENNDVTEQFKISYEEASLRIGEKAVKVSASETKRYTGGEQSLAIGESESREIEGLIEGHTIEIREAKIKGTDVGSYDQVEEGWQVKIKDAAGKDVSANYKVSVSGKLIIEKERFEASVELQDWTYGEEESEEVAEVSGGDYSSARYEYKKQGAEEESYSEIKPKEAGRYVVRAIWEGTANCEEIWAEDEFEIRPRRITIRANDAEKYFGEADPEFSWEVREGELAGTDTAEDLGEIQIKRRSGAEGVGEYEGELEIELSEENPNYQIEKESGKLTIKIAHLEGAGVSSEGGSWVYDGEKHSVRAELENAEGYEIRYSTDGGNSWSIEAPSVQEVKEGVIRVQVKAVREGYEELYAEEVTLEVTAKEVTIRANDAEKGYREADPAFSIDEADLKSQLIKEGDLGEVRAYRSNDDEAADVYEEVIEVSYEANSNYHVSVEAGTFTIKAQSLADAEVITVGSLEDVVYNGESQKQEPAVQGKAGTELVKGRDYTISYSEDTTNVGTVTVTVTGCGNYRGSVEREYKITKRRVEIHSGDAERVYTGEELTNKQSTVIGGVGFIKGDATYKVSGSITEVGETKNTITITWSSEEKARNYEVILKEGKLKVTEQSLAEADVITVGSLEDVIYNGREQAQKPAVKAAAGADLVEGRDYRISFSEDTVNAGEVIVTITGCGNYAGTVTRSYEIMPKPVTIRVNDAEKVYGEADPAFSIDEEDLNSQLIKEGDIPGIRVTRSNQEEEAGRYEKVLKASYVDNSNYTITVKEGAFTIKAQSLAEAEVITVGNLGNLIYNGESQKQEPAVQGKAGTELVKERDYTISYSEDTTNVGTVIVTVTGCGNYTGSVTRKYAIMPRPVMIEAEDSEKVYGAEDPVFTGTVKGLVREGDLGEIRYFRTNEEEEAGTYEAVLEAAYTENKNYEVEVVRGSFVIHPQSLAEAEVITVGSLEDVIYNGREQAQKPVVKAAAGAELVEGRDYRISFSEDTVNAGEVTVTITGCGNYAGTVIRSYEIMPKPVTIRVNDAEKFYGEADPIFAGSVEGMIEGERLQVSYYREGEEEEAGMYEGAVQAEYEANGNYEVRVEEGSFRIKAQSIEEGEEGYQGVEAAEPEDVRYNGQSQRWEAEVRVENGVVLEEGRDYEVIYSEDTVNAGEVEVLIRGIGNYRGELRRSYRIMPAGIRITTGSAERAYNGAALVAGGRIEGLMPGESVTLRLLGSQTEVGSSRNGYELIWNGTAREGNYEIEEESIGELRITAVPAVPGGETPVITIEEEEVPQGARPEEEESYQLSEQEEVEIEENETPMGNMEVEEEHECCILHLILLLLALGVEVYYTHDRKKRQKRMFELKNEMKGLGKH